MMKKYKLIILLLTVTSLCYGQAFKPSNQDNTSLDFNNFLSGVKYAYIGIDDENFQYLKEYPRCSNANAILGLIKYLEYIGFENVNWGAGSSIPQNYPSICDLVIVSPAWTIEDYTYKNVTLTFFSCNGDNFSFESSKKIRIDGYTNIETSFFNLFLKMYGYKKNPYSENQRLSIENELTNWSEEKLKIHFKEKGADPLEGIYEMTVKNEQAPKYKLGVVKTDEGYDLIYISGAINYLDWKEGELKAKLTPTATPSLYKTAWKMGNKDINENPYIIFEQGLMNLVMQGNDKTLYIKLFPTSGDNISSTIKAPSSGTGFAVSSDGLIITNNHVVNDAKSIKVRGINGDFTKSYNAKVVTVDKNNDLAIIKIDDTTFKTLGSVPFVISAKSSDVGSSIFVLGYPLRASMGDEIKLTNGIISSKSGFQGDVTCYQITAPIQPGNSGGPLFDEKGNLIGIVNAKHAGAENASYAIKSSFLLNLFDLIPIPPKLQTISIVSGKTLPEQVKILKQFTYIIEVNLDE